MRDNLEQSRTRIVWIDIVKLLGMFAIYLGHFSVDAGHGYWFVFTHHVALFFFVSGCVENFAKEETLYALINKKIKTIIIPYVFFALVAIVIQTILNDWSLNDIDGLLLMVLLGAIRNRFIAGALWFLTCLFVLEIMFYIIRKVKNRLLILLICLSIFIYADKVLNPHPLVHPSLIWNIDSALYYIIFYALGYILFPWIKKLFMLDSPQKKVFFVVSGCIAFIYTAFLFFGKDIMACITDVLYLDIVVSIGRPLMVTYLYFVIAKICENISILSELGKDTLFLCGSEMIVKVFVSELVGMCGLRIVLNNPLAVYIYVVILLVVAWRYLVPVEKRILDVIKNFNVVLKFM